MPDTRVAPGRFVQWHSGHGTGVVYTAVAVEASEVDARLTDDVTPVRILAVEAFPAPGPALPAFDGRPVSSASIGTTRGVPNTRLRLLSLRTVAHAYWQNEGGDIVMSLTDAVTCATFAAAALSLPDPVYADVDAPLTSEQAASVAQWLVKA